MEKVLGLLYAKHFTRNRNKTENAGQKRLRYHTIILFWCHGFTVSRRPGPEPRVMATFKLYAEKKHWGSKSRP
jgi:hypothetical protein